MHKLLKYAIIAALTFAPLLNVNAAGWLPLVKSAGGGYTGPGDIVAFTWWGGFRAYSAATAGTKAVRIVRASDSTQTDINTLTNGSFDAASATSFCASTTCKIVTVYDKVGTNDATQATDANRLALTANALNSSYCMTSTNGTPGTTLLTAATFTANQPYSFGIIVNSATGGSNPIIMSVDNAFAGAGLFSTSTTGIQAEAGVALNVTITAAFHAIQVVFNTTSSVVGVDNVETTGSAGTNNLSSMSLGLPGNPGGNSSINGVICEGYFIAGTVSAGNRTSLNSNMHSAYGSW